MFSRRALFICLLVLAVIVAAPGCKEKRRGKLGSTCTSDTACASGFCYASLCLDPAADDDYDGLINQYEKDLSTNPLDPDSDHDGVDDRSEVGAEFQEPGDADRDGRHDALESRTNDKDKDCIPDQFDPDDGEVEIDADVVAKLACKSMGACGAPGALVTASCSTGAVLSCDYSAVPAYEAEVETLCDGKDNDCDGKTDELLAYVDVDGEVKLLGASCAGFGACGALAGVVECDALGDTVCSVNKGGSAAAGAAAEVACNNIDDDCDGETDDDVIWVDPDTAEQKPYGATCGGQGVCSLVAGHVECDPGSGEAICSVMPGGSEDPSAAEVCDGQDNDCDGDTDEGMTWESHTGAALALGAACGTGACFGGQVICGSGGVATCSTLGQALAGGKEVCNEVDDDCDGDTDELEGLAKNCLQLGVCETILPSGVQCLDNGTVACFYLGVEGYEHEVETSCNGLDDDCDGQTDEDLTSDQGVALGQPCTGRGACAGLTGAVVCPPANLADEHPGALCSANLTDAEETCDGVDEDCDGQTDEGLDQAPDLSGQCPALGVCAKWVGAASECVDGEWSCPHVEDPSWQPLELSCDSKDNDCDGVTDEDTSKHYTGALTSVTAEQPAHRAVWRVVDPGDGSDAVLFGGLHLVDQAGQVVGSVLGDTWRFTAATGTWTQVEPALAPPARAMHATAWAPAAQRVIVHGGITMTPGSPVVDGVGTRRFDMWAFDPATDSWSQVSQLSLPSESAIARSHHSLVALGDGTLLLHGGQADGALLPLTLVGTLQIGVDGAVTCTWGSAPAQAPARVNHAAVHDPASGVVYLVGGGTAPGTPFAQRWAAGDAAWSAVGTSTQPSARSFVAAAITADKLVVVGGAASTAAWPTGGPETGATWVWSPGPAKWQELAIGGLPASSGAAAWSVPAGEDVTLIGGAATVGTSWRSGRTLHEAAWSDPAAWAGPEPRTGAAIAVEPDSGVVWLLGGARGPGKAALQDVWSLDPEVLVWEPEVGSASPNAPSPDLTRPAVEGGAALWDAVGGRVLLFGGQVPDAAAPSDTLWAFAPEEATFAAADAQGDKPPGAVHPVFGVAPGAAEAWLVGLFGADLELRVYRLGLAGLDWTEVWSAADGGGPPDVAELRGGVGSAGVRVVLRGSDGFPRPWTFSAGTWTDDTTTTGVVPYSTFHAGAYHPVSDRTLVLAESQIDGSLFALQYGHGSGTFGLLPLSGPWPEGLTGAAMLSHPSLGGLVFGGHDPSGVADAVWFLADQGCTPN